MIVSAAPEIAPTPNPIGVVPVDPAASSDLFAALLSSLQAPIAASPPGASSPAPPGVIAAPIEMEEAGTEVSRSENQDSTGTEAPIPADSSNALSGVNIPASSLLLAALAAAPSPLPAPTPGAPALAVGASGVGAEAPVAEPLSPPSTRSAATPAVGSVSEAGSESGSIAVPVALGPVSVVGGSEEPAPPAAATSPVSAAAALANESGGEPADGGRERGSAAGAPTPSLLPDRPAGVRESGRAEAPLAPLSPRERMEAVLQVTRQIERLDITSVRRPLEIRIEPAELGQVTVTLSREAGAVNAGFTASDPRVAAALDRHRNELAGALASRGFESARITVVAASPSPRSDLAGSFGDPRGGTPARREQTRPDASPSRRDTPVDALASVRRTSSGRLDIAI